MAKSIAKQVASLLEGDPYTRQSLKLGIANYSAIAKKLKKEHLEKASLEAVKAAVRRYSLVDDSFDYITDLKGILKGTKIILKSDVGVLLVFADTPLDLDKISRRIGKDFSIVRASHATTIITSQEHLDVLIKIIGKQNLIRSLKDHYLLTLQSPEGIETAPGFVAFFTEILARSGINIREYYSCYTDTVFVLAKKDALKAYSLFDRVLG